MAAWGHHLIIDAAGCNENLLDGEAIKRFSKDLVDEIDMVAFGEPMVEHFGHANPKTSGYTLVQLIETSNVTAHFCDDSREIYLDVFSCRDFEEAKAVAVFQRHFEPARMKVTKFARKAPSMDAEAVEVASIVAAA